MSTKCFALVRGSAIRATALDDCGRPGDPVMFATSKAVASVRVNEIVETAKVETERNPDEEARVRFVRPAQFIRNTVDIKFTCVDPDIYRLVAARVGPLVPVETDDDFGFDEGGFGEGGFGGVGGGGGEGTGGGFGEGGFGEMGFGEGESSDTGPLNGFEIDTRALPTSFALEVWSKLAGQRCEDGTPMWGYTLFQHLRGGRISGFVIANGLVSFDLIGAMSRRTREWGVGPYDLEGDFERMVSVVSRNNAFRQMITTGAPPAGAVGLQTRYDIISNGNAVNPMPDPDAPLVLSGGGAATSPYIISGGRA